MSDRTVSEADQMFTSPERWMQRYGIEKDQRQYHRVLEAIDLLRCLDVDDEGILVSMLFEITPHFDDRQELMEIECSDSTIDLLNRIKRIYSLSETLYYDQSRVSKPQEQEENLRKMLITMVDDVRAVLIVLVHQLVKMRYIKYESPQQQITQGTITKNVFAPLANRLSIWQLKWELEDLSFRCLNADAYRKLAHQLEEKRISRECYIDSFVAEVQSLLLAEGIEATVRGRPKHIYSIWKKMQRKGLTFNDLWDIRAVRILVDDIESCYSALSIIHEKWSYHASEFSDYIAVPKSNGYRSIHTVVIGPEQKSIEIQIRTFNMHQDSELGMAAHWRYKEQVGQNDNLDRKIIWLRELLDWKSELTNKPLRDHEKAEDEALPATDLNTRIYVFTPKGSIVDLPKGATPIDFAYAIHSEVGHRTRGAKVNDKMVALNTPLNTGDCVHIQTVKKGGPSKDWLRADLAYVCTQKAKNRIAHWHKQTDYEKYISEGRVLLEKELERLDMEDLSYEKINQHTHFKTTNDLLAAIGSRDYKVSKALYPFKTHITTDEGELTKVKIKPESSKEKNRNKGQFIVQGVGNLLTHMAQCCNPLPSDTIIGFITRGRGVTIHRKHCKNIANLNQEKKHRLLDVRWGLGGEEYTLNLCVSAYQRSGLLNDITEVLKPLKVDVLKMNMEVDADHVSRMKYSLSVPAHTKSDEVIKRLAMIKNVFEVKR